MVRFLPELFCCIALFQEIPQPLSHDLFPNQQSTVVMSTPQEYDDVYAQYAPRIMRELGNEIQELCWHFPCDARAQFINRYINVLVKRLTLIPAPDRESELDTLKLLVPINKDEYDYIRGEKNPIPIKAIGKQECWSLRNKEFHDRINDIRDRIKAEKVNHSELFA